MERNQNRLLQTLMEKHQKEIQEYKDQLAIYSQLLVEKGNKLGVHKEVQAGGGGNVGIGVTAADDTIETTPLISSTRGQTLSGQKT